MTGKTVRILLVEDDEVDAENVVRAFDKACIENIIYKAKDGIQALDMLRGTNGIDKISMPLIILVDINMPRMDGIEFVKEIRADKNFNKSIIFMLTTSRNDSDKTAAYDLNVAGYLVKPPSFDVLVSMMQMLENYWLSIEFPE